MIPQWPVAPLSCGPLVSPVCTPLRVRLPLSCGCGCLRRSAISPCVRGLALASLLCALLAVCASSAPLSASAIEFRAASRCCSTSPLRAMAPSALPVPRPRRFPRVSPPSAARSRRAFPPRLPPAPCLPRAASISPATCFSRPSRPLAFRAASPAWGGSARIRPGHMSSFPPVTARRDGQGTYALRAPPLESPPLCPHWAAGARRKLPPPAASCLSKLQSAGYAEGRRAQAQRQRSDDTHTQEWIVGLNAMRNTARANQLTNFKEPRSGMQAPN
eukprot:GHVT01022102.1.p1 GENE.GHVT01022102.1~~GHVT01022102.1.p1  ORF type:complete len:274 (+),score=53.56 GHVT01022102.1:1268-2089(+)